MKFIGIDPGLDGAIAILMTGPHHVVASVKDTPTGKDSKRRIYLLGEMRQLLLNWSEYNQDNPVTVFIEKVHSMPKQGVASSFNFGQGYGIWQGLVVALGLPIEYVAPQTWMKEMFRDRPIGKDASRARAQELFPELVDQLNLKKHHGRSDALLIAEYGRRTYGS